MYSFIHIFNTLRPRQNGRHFPDIFKCIFFNKNVWISLRFHWSLFLIFELQYSRLVQIMAWCRPGGKPLSEPMVVSLPTHICVTRPQWVKHSTQKGKIKWIRFTFAFSGWILQSKPVMLTWLKWQNSVMLCCDWLLMIVHNELHLRPLFKKGNVFKRWIPDDRGRVHAGCSLNEEFSVKMGVH